MTEWYNTTNFTDGDSFLAIFRFANEATANMFGTLFLLGFFVVLMVVLGKYEVKNRIAVASWATSIIGIIYVPLGLMNQWVIYLMVILFVGGFIGLFVGE